MATSYDYSTLYKTFSRLIKSRLNLIMIELNGNGKPPEAPFVTFDIISPKIPLGFLEDDRAFECVVSFTVYAKRKLEAMQLCNTLRSMLGDTDSRDTFDKNDIVMVERMPIQARYVEETNTYAYMFGFDVKLRLWETYVDGHEGIIEHVKYKEETDE